MVKLFSHDGRRPSAPLSTPTGFSVVELLVVVALLLIMVAISIPFLASYRKLYRSEDQALKIMDILREGNQLALNRRRTIRVEIDLTSNAILLIDENNTDPDTLIKSIPLDSTAELRVDTAPTGITRPNPPNYPNAAFATDNLGHWQGTTHTNGHNVWTARFRSDGSVVNAAGTTPLSSTLYIWPPKTPGGSVARAKEEVRAITLFGGSGAVRYWKHNGTTFVAY